MSLERVGKESELERVDSKESERVKVANVYCIHREQKRVKGLKKKEKKPRKGKADIRLAAAKQLRQVAILNRKIRFTLREGMDVKGPWQCRQHS